MPTINLYAFTACTRRTSLVCLIINFFFNWDRAGNYYIKCNYNFGLHVLLTCRKLQYDML